MRIQLNDSLYIEDGNTLKQNQWTIGVFSNQSFNDKQYLVIKSHYVMEFTRNNMEISRILKYLANTLGFIICNIRSVQTPVNKDQDHGTTDLYAVEIKNTSMAKLLMIKLSL